MSRAAPLSAPERRATILAAARAVFAARGYHVASVSDIVAASGVARGTFYNHFDSKRDVFAAVLVALMEEIVGAVAPIDVARPVPPQVRHNLRALLGAMANAGDAVRILFTDAGAVDAEGQAALAAFYTLVVMRVERALVTGQTLGVVRAGAMHHTARCLLGLLKEPVMLSTLAGEPLDADGVAEAIFSLLQGGVLRAAG